jgi:hypothetical protein
MFTFLLVVIHILQYNTIQANDSIIWSKNEQNFRSLFNRSIFSQLKNNYMKKIRDREIHNFQREIVVISYYQVN